MPHGKGEVLRFHLVCSVLLSLRLHMSEKFSNGMINLQTKKQTNKILRSKAHQDLLSLCICDTSISKTSLLQRNLEKKSKCVKFRTKLMHFDTKYFSFRSANANNICIASIRVFLFCSLHVILFYLFRLIVDIILPR